MSTDMMMIPETSPEAEKIPSSGTKKSSLPTEKTSIKSFSGMCAEDPRTSFFHESQYNESQYSRKTSEKALYIAIYNKVGNAPFLPFQTS